MKKYLISLSFLIASIFCIGNVKALNSNVSYVLSSNNNNYYEENDFNFLGSFKSSSRYHFNVNLYYKNDILYFSTVNNSLILDTTQEAMDGFSLETIFLQNNSLYGSYTGLYAFDNNAYIKSYYNGLNFCYTIKYNNIGMIYLHLNVSGSNDTISSLFIDSGANYDNGVGTTNMCADSSIVPNIYNNRDFLVYNGSPVYDSEFTDNTMIDSSTISSISEPSEIYFTTMPIYDTDNAGDSYVKEMNIGVNFDIYDTENYNYWYKFNDSIWTSFNNNDQIIHFTKNGTLYVKVEDKQNNLITSSTYTIVNIDDTPKIFYEVEINKSETLKRKDNRQIYNIKLTFKNMTEDYYVIYYNMRDGTSKNLGYDVQSHDINNVNDDAIFSVFIYDKNNNKLDQATIDISLFTKDLNDPYIRIIGRDFVNLKNTVSYTYNNTNDNDYTCYYMFGGDSEKTQESCDSNNIITRHASYNTYLQIFIYDSNNKIVDQKNVNLMFFTGYPRINFESYYSGISKSQVLDVYLLDFNAEKDTLFYTTDGTNWEQLLTEEKNTLYFTENTDVYFKIYRDNEPVGDAFYRITVGTYSLSISENKTTEEIKVLTSDKTSDYVKNFLNEISLYATEFSKLLAYLFNSLNSTIKSFLIAIFVVGLLCSIILIARGRR